MIDSVIRKVSQENQANPLCWVGWITSLNQTSKFSKQRKKTGLILLLKVQSLLYLLNTVNWSQQAQGCILNWERSCKETINLGHVNILLSVLKQSLMWGMFLLTTKPRMKLAEYLKIMKNWQCSPMLLLLEVIIWRMIPHGRKFTNATDTGKLCSVNLMNCKEGHNSYCKVSEILTMLIGRFYTKDALSVWTNLGKHL